MDIEIPKKKSATLTKRVLLAVDDDLKELIDTLKNTSNYDIPEYMRMILRRELPKLANKGQA